MENKNILTILVIAALFMPTISFAKDITPGPVTIHEIIPFYYEPCSDLSYVSQKNSWRFCYLSNRIYELEVAVQSLQAQTQKQPASPAQQFCNCDAKIASIETRLSTFEKTVEFLQTNVIGLLKTIVSFLIK